VILIPWKLAAAMLSVLKLFALKLIA